MEKTDSELIAEVLQGNSQSFEPLIIRYQPRVFATARRYARRENEVQDIVQEIFLKTFQKLSGFRGDAPFEHWLMKVAVRTCYDFLRGHQRNRESSFTDLSEDQSRWLERFTSASNEPEENITAARELLARIMDELNPEEKMIITMLELEEKSIKEIAGLTGWSLPLVKVRAFRARSQMKKILNRLAVKKYL